MHTLTGKDMVAEFEAAMRWGEAKRRAVVNNSKWSLESDANLYQFASQ
jgi:hypothetical protein